MRVVYPCHSAAWKKYHRVLPWACHRLQNATLRCDRGASSKKWVCTQPCNTHKVFLFKLLMTDAAVPMPVLHEGVQILSYEVDLNVPSTLWHTVRAGSSIKTSDELESMRIMPQIHSIDPTLVFGLVSELDLNTTSALDSISWSPLHPLINIKICIFACQWQHKYKCILFKSEDNPFQVLRSACMLQRSFSNPTFRQSVAALHRPNFPKWTIAESTHDVRDPISRIEFYALIQLWIACMLPAKF